ncbi:MAG: FAD-dependent oxidoreductase [Gemmatales bacterium]
MRIAIIGSGISGLVCAYFLSKHHEVTIYEASDRVGGHTHTVQTPSGHAVDTGFIVFNYENYPNFTGLLRELGVTAQPTSMSFSITCESSGLEYSTASLNHLFAQRRNLFSPVFYSMLQGILRFNSEVTQLLTSISESVTVAEFLKQHRYSESFIKNFLYPISTALWSCPQSSIESFPMRFILEFYQHHGMHKILNQPGWHVIQGGSYRYVEKMIVSFRDRIRLQSPVTRLTRTDGIVQLHSQHGQEEYDEVILACHSNQALNILGDDASQLERELLSAFPYSRNAVTLHTDTAVLPRNRRAWASWNSRVERVPATQAKVTYNMNMLQSLQASETFCVSLNQNDAISAKNVIKYLEYEHPLYDTRRAEAQKRHGEVIRQARTSFCGAYWGNGFHEAGVASAMRVCQAYHALPSWAQVTNKPTAESRC